MVNEVQYFEEGSLALQPEKVNKDKRLNKRKTEDVDNLDYSVYRNYCLIFFGIILFTYALVVFRSYSFYECGQTLIAMKTEESKLIADNKILQIEVEILKGPSRIVGYARNRLGMEVARENIYIMKAGE